MMPFNSERPNAADASQKPIEPPTVYVCFQAARSGGAAPDEIYEPSAAFANEDDAKGYCSSYYDFEYIGLPLQSAPPAD